MPYQPKHEKNEQRHASGGEQEATSGPNVGDAAKGLVVLLTRAGKQELLNLIFLSMIEDLLGMVLPLVEDKRPDGDGAPDPLATALAFGAAERE